MEHILFWIIVGAVAGLLAKAVMPGSSDEPSGWLMTIVLGIVGAVVGGWIAAAMGLGASGWIGTTLVAFVGACIVIALMRLFTRGGRTYSSY